MKNETVEVPIEWLERLRELGSKLESGNVRTLNSEYALLLEHIHFVRKLIDEN